ncbi:MAG: sialidase family protein [Kiritimatiellae bacterium]|nr:sialidase family protein [Kiritimatiellia bacterium]
MIKFVCQLRLCYAALFGLFLCFAGSARGGEAGAVVWQHSTVRLVAAGGCYARMSRLHNGNILCCYHKERQIWIKSSADEGQSWGAERPVTAYSQGLADNPELLQLKDGRLMLCYNERPDDGESPYAISIVYSADNGLNWGTAQRLFEAGHTFASGCWEPAPLQFPDGEIQIYFANEASYTYSNEQEISVLRSGDSGKSWQGAKTLAFRAQHRDGMPVPCLLNDGLTVVVAIEDNGLSGEMKPVVLRDSVESRWQTSILSGNSPGRESALAQPLAPEVYVGAPYICQMPSGMTLLSVQSRERVPDEEPVVYTGDAQARNFGHPSFPFKLEPGVAGLWNSLFVKNAETVTLISTTTLNGRSGIWAIDGVVKSAWLP